MLTKVDDLTEEPVVGRYYLVPCVRVERAAGMTGGGTIYLRKQSHAV